MFSRIIIEQKLADLELALARQDELIKSQREVIRGLKDLISMEYQNAWQGNVSAVPPSAAAVLPPARAAHTTTTTSNSVVGNTKRSHDQVNHTSNVTTSTQRTSMSVQEAISSSVDSAKKRTKTDRDSTDSTSSSSSSSASKQPTTTTTTANIPTSSLSTPAHGQVPVSVSHSLIPHWTTRKLKRSSLFCRLVF